MKFSNRQWIAGIGLRETGLAAAAAALALALGACGGDSGSAGGHPPHI